MIFPFSMNSRKYMQRFKLSQDRKLREIDLYEFINRELLRLEEK